MTYGDWTRDLHWSWLYALWSLADGPEAGAPAFVVGDAWDARELSTAAAGWALLRNTWGSPAAEASERPRATEPRGEPPLVEPHPQLYERLRELTDNLSDRLLENGLLGSEIAADLDRHASLLSVLERRARATLDERMPRGIGRGDDRAAARGDSAKPGSVSGRLEGHASTGLHVAFSEVAYRDLVSGRVLEVALGDLDLIYVLVRGPEGETVYAGPVFSFYEFQRESVLDVGGSEWPSIVRGGDAQRPAWVARFLTE